MEKKKVRSPREVAAENFLSPGSGLSIFSKSCIMRWLFPSTSLFFLRNRMRIGIQLNGGGCRIRDADECAANESGLLTGIGVAWLRTKMTQELRLSEKGAC
ncbi:hypothetical protein AVEN_172343-1 [Araneus ventricosus]|uniref:Uncharacterized protein n=1 Tax=Araneus ventricosus TaxID=182803 RepID=A0A4Y2E2V3_ARAVE|nr:hypothetical protein AVEN_172343-1 [Araneus ventricosus]